MQVLGRVVAILLLQPPLHSDEPRDGFGSEELPDVVVPGKSNGMGLERVAAILQGAYSNYDTDCFQSVLKKAAELAGRTYGEDEEADVSMRVIADHSRAAAFLIADGIMPSNEERGYVLRRIMRRAIRYGVKMGLKDPFLYKTANAVIDLMGEAYPELIERRGFIEEVIRGEEERFAETLEKGLQILEDALEASQGKLAGEVVFKLYDTYGFPLDLTRLIADERGVELDEEGYHSAMEAQRAAGRAAWRGSGEEARLSIEGELNPSTFQGYTHDESQHSIGHVFQDGRAVAALEEGNEGVLVFDTTPFYAEAGGQVGDSGTISTESGSFKVTDVQKGRGESILHIGTVSSGQIAVGQRATLTVDATRRNRIRLNHTATHLLHAALKKTLGDHVTQKGSLVDDERLRFDFSHHKPMTPAELAQVEQLVFAEILKNSPLETQLMDSDSAVASGAMALFGEKYSEQVRVVSIDSFSNELCGGTHARATGDIGLFKITSEGGVAAGVRRIEGITGHGAFQWLSELNESASEATKKLKSTVSELPAAVDRLLSERKRLEKEIDGLRRELASKASGDLLDSVQDIGGIKVLAAELPGDAGTLRDQADSLRSKMGSGVVVLGSRDQGSVLLVAAATKDVISRGVHAGNLIREVAKLVGGGGGGRPDMAQAGGKNPEALPEALEKVYQLIESR